MRTRRFRAVLTGIAVAIGVLSAANQVRVFVCSPPVPVPHQTAQRSERTQPPRQQSGVDLGKLSNSAASTVEIAASNPVSLDVRDETDWPAELTSSTRPVYRQQLMVTTRVLNAAFRTAFGARAGQAIVMQGWGGLAQRVAGQVEPWVQKNRARLRPLDR